MDETFGKVKRINGCHGNMKPICCSHVNVDINMASCLKENNLFFMS